MYRLNLSVEIKESNLVYGVLANSQHDGEVTKYVSTTPVWLVRGEKEGPEVTGKSTFLRNA